MNHYKVCIFVPASNDDMVEGDPGSDGDFEIKARKEVSLWCNRKLSSTLNYLTQYFVYSLIIVTLHTSFDSILFSRLNGILVVKTKQQSGTSEGKHL